MPQDLTTNDIERLTKIAEYLYPLSDEMCAGCRVTVNNNRQVFVWKMKKELKPLSEGAFKKLLNELEAKAGIEPEIHKTDQPMDE